AHALHGVDDGVVGGAAFIGGAGRQNVLPARGGGVEVVDDDDDAVVLVEDGVAYAGCQAVVPEAAVAHDGDGALGRRHVEGRGAGGAQAVAHGRGAQVEGRQNREQMAADVAGDVVFAQFFLGQAKRRKYRTLGTAGTEAGRPGRHHLGQFADLALEV